MVFKYTYTYRVGCTMLFLSSKLSWFLFYSLSISIPHLAYAIFPIINTCLSLSLSIFFFIQDVMYSLSCKNAYFSPIALTTIFTSISPYKYFILTTLNLINRSSIVHTCLSSIDPNVYLWYDKIVTWFQLLILSNLIISYLSLNDYNFYRHH